MCTAAFVVFVWDLKSFTTRSVPKKNKGCHAYA